MPENACAQFDEDLVERYSLGRLTETESARFEEHFLLCEACQERLRSSDEFVDAVKAAAAQSVRAKPARAVLIRKPVPLGDRS